MNRRPGGWALIVHGGAKPIAPEEEEENRDGVRQALAAGRALLEAGGSALDAAEAAVRVLEDLPAFNAGRGAALNERGDIEMSAAIMDGRDLAVGAIADVGRIRSPIGLARKLLPEAPVLLVGEGAILFAEQQGAEFCDPAELITEKQRRALAEHKEQPDTVGAVALDGTGNLVAATATGGLTGTKVGRVSDSAMPGAGFYADDPVGAVVFSGTGESIARLALAARVMADMDQAGPEEAVRRAVEQIPRLGGDGGAIAISRDGRIGWWHNSPGFAVASASSEHPEPKAWLSKEEERATHG